MGNGVDGHLGHLVALTVSSLDQDLVIILLHLMREQIAVEPLSTIILVLGEGVQVYFHSQICC